VVESRGMEVVETTWEFKLSGPVSSCEALEIREDIVE